MIFNSSDAWLLESIKFSERDQGATLTDIISTADYINRAIITFAELDTGVKKLMSAGLIIEKDRRLHTTSKFNEWWSKKFENKKRIGLLKTMNEIEKYLNKTYTALDTASAESIFSLTEFDKAVASYLSQAR